MIIGDQSYRYVISKVQPRIAVAQPMLRRGVREYRQASAMDRRWITNHRRSHQICIADVYTSMLKTSSMCRRCVWDLLNLGVLRRMFADCSALFGDIFPMVLGVETSGENFKACIDFFLDIPMPWRRMAMARVRGRLIPALLVKNGAGLAMTKFEHCESIGIGRLKKSRGTVYHDTRAVRRLEACPILKNKTTNGAF